MSMEQYIINDVQPLDVNDAITIAQRIFSQLTYSHLPVIQDGKYIGCVAETDAHCFESGQKLTDVKYALDGFHVKVLMKCCKLSEGIVM